MNNKLQKVHKSILYFAICISILLCSVAPGFVAGAASHPVKVGFFAFDGYHMQDESSKCSGYGYDIVNYMFSYMDSKCEFVGYDMSWDEAQKALESGKIDILTSARKTADRLKKFDYSTRSIGISSTILTVKKGNTKYIIDDIKNWNGMSVGMLKGNSRNDSFASYASDQGFTYSTVFYNSIEEMSKALQNNEVDAIVSSNLRKTESEWILAQFDASPFYAIVKKGNAKLLNQINSALTALYTAVPNLNQKLMKKYYQTADGANVALTEEENEIVVKSQKTPLKVGIMLSGEPICYKDKETGKYMGICMEVLREISDKTDLKFKYVVIDQAKTSPIEELKAGNVDLVARIFKTDRFTSDASLIFSDTLMTDSVAMVGRVNSTFADGKDNKSIAIPAGFTTGSTYVEEYYPNYRVVNYDSIEDCLKAVSDGKVDSAVYLYNRIAYLLLNPHYENLSVVPAFVEDLPSSIIGLANKDKATIDLIDKGFSMITESERNAIMLNYTILNTYKMSFSDIVYKYRLPIIIISVLLLLLILSGVLMLLNRRNNNLKLQQSYAQVKDALSQAEQANAAKSQFLSRVSHEMRTPLNAIIGFIELAKDGDNEQRENYRVSSDIAAKQLLNVINDVLDMSSIEAGKLKIAEAPFNFKHLITSITNIYGTQCKQKGINFETQITVPTKDWLIGDELRINQILMNLLSNAVKFTANGSITLKISETAATEDNIFLRFEVSDTGCGMSKEMSERLFKPFEQESASTAKKYGGSGLGLSIVKNLTDMMQGNITAKSVQSKGTTFIVDLPFKLSSIEDSPNLPEKLESIRILSVDDQKSEREYISAVLSRMGVRFTCVSGAKEALQALEKSEKESDLYNVCLVDWRMPDVNGIEATRKIREKYGKDVVVIVVSAYDFHQATESAREAGANLFISKPLFQSSLFDLLMTLTGGDITKKVEDSKQIWNFTGKRVLLAEDNTLNQIVTKGYLAKSNVVIDLAENGQIAVDKFLASEPGYYDAILMDIQMPIMDGFEATKAIRESSHPQAESIQIIAQTADAFNEDITKALSFGMNAHIAKPIKQELLAKALHQAFMIEENSGDKND